MSNEPINHHYLPQFYLKGFSELKRSSYRVYSYDKEHERKVIKKSIKNICCEKHRYTVSQDGVNDYFIEKSYSELEGIMSEVFRAKKDFVKLKLIEKKRAYKLWDRRKFIKCPEVISLDDILKIPFYGRIFNYFLSVLYWRSTVHDEYFLTKANKSFISSSIKKVFSGFSSDKEFSSSFGFNNTEELDCLVESVDSNISKDSIAKIHNSLIYPLHGLFKNRAKTHELSLVYIADLNVVSSDFPFFTNGSCVNLENDFLFAMSSKLIFVNVDRKKRINIEDFSDWTFKLSMLYYLQSKRYVFSNDKELLENVIKFANVRYGSTGINELKKELLSYFV